MVRTNPEEILFSWGLLASVVKKTDDPHRKITILWIVQRDLEEHREAIAAYARDNQSQSAIWDWANNLPDSYFHISAYYVPEEDREMLIALREYKDERNGVKEWRNREEYLANNRK